NPRHASLPTLRYFWSGRGGLKRGDRADLVGTKARPVGVTGHDDRRLEVPETANHLERLGVLRDVDDRVLDALAIQCPVRRVALDARRLAVDRDAHVRLL